MSTEQGRDVFQFIIGPEVIPKLKPAFCCQQVLCVGSVRRFSDIGQV
jgi:hypothetical protein